jgi:hypothetical protein
LQAVLCLVNPAKIAATKRQLRITTITINLFKLDGFALHAMRNTIAATQWKIHK